MLNSIIDSISIAILSSVCPIVFKSKYEKWKKCFTEKYCIIVTMIGILYNFIDKSYTTNNCNNFDYVDFNVPDCYKNFNKYFTRYKVIHGILNNNEYNKYKTNKNDAYSILLNIALLPRNRLLTYKHSISDESYKSNYNHPSFRLDECELVLLHFLCIRDEILKSIKSIKKVYIFDYIFKRNVQKFLDMCFEIKEKVLLYKKQIEIDISNDIIKLDCIDFDIARAETPSILKQFIPEVINNRIIVPKFNDEEEYNKYKSKIDKLHERIYRTML